MGVTSFNLLNVLLGITEEETEVLDGGRICKAVSTGTRTRRGMCIDLGSPSFWFTPFVSLLAETDPHSLG